jgi:SsrA-binding protein
MEKLIQNKEARFNYEILEEFEAGLQLKGDEIKSIRSGRVNLKGSYGKIFYSGGKPEVFLVGAHFFTTTLDPYRTKKLLLKKEEIKKLVGKTQEKGLTLVPLSIYFKRGRAKLKIGVGRGKKTFDKRELIRKREIDRKIARVVKNLK